jgi:D-alanine-D-alanine ligase
MKKNVALVTGGYSGEAEISYKSVITIENNIDTDKYNVYKIDIHPNHWQYIDPTGKAIPVNKEDFSVTINGEKVKFDVALLCIHGSPGEDGKLQGYFDMVQMPYTSCDAACSALTFNKRHAVAVAAFGGIAVARSMHSFKSHPISAEEMLAKLQLPLFVKPNNGGSSIGMSKVIEPEELEPALEKAFKEDSEVLVEEFISGREFTVGVFKKNGQIIVLPVTEVISQNDFFDFEAKYRGKSEEVTPAAIDEFVEFNLQQAAKKVYQIFNCRGVVRIDFIYNEHTGQPYMLEVNTVPGQSEASIIPQQVKTYGWTLKEFYSAVIDEAI